MKYFEKFGHRCPVKHDVALETYLDEMSWLQHMMTIDPNSPITAEFYSSHSSVINGMKEHLQHHPSIIHPFSRLKLLIEIYMMVVYGCGLIYTPLLYMYYVGKDHVNTFGNMEMIYFIKVSCLFDILLRFFTGRVDRRRFEIILDRRQIARKYLGSLFVFDFITNFPFFFALLAGLGPNDREFHLVKLTVLFRICRLPACVRYGQRLMVHLGISDAYVFIFKLCAYWSCLVHWAACLHMAPGIIVSGFRVGVKTGAWFENIYFTEKNALGKYTICLFKAVKTLFGTGYLHDLLPQAYFDRIYACLLAIIGRICLCTTLALMYQLVRSVKSASLKYDEMMVQLNKYTACNRLPATTHTKLRNNYDHMFCRHFFNEREILATVSLPLRQEIMMHNTRQLVERSPFFENLPSSLVTRIIAVLTSELFFENDTIYNSGDAGSSIYFITSGRVVFYSPCHNEVCHYSDGDYFGEMSFISNVDYRFCKAVALETTDCYKLSRDDFQQLVASYPDLLTKVETLALERMEHIFLIEECSNVPNVGYVSINQRRYSVHH